MDTVHQGDQGSAKGVYHINAVDEVTQWQIVAVTERISEAWLEPVLVVLLSIGAVHSDTEAAQQMQPDKRQLFEQLRLDASRRRA